MAPSLFELLAGIARRGAAIGALLLPAACTTTGSAWMAQPLPGQESGDDFVLAESDLEEAPRARERTRSESSRNLAATQAAKLSPETQPDRETEVPSLRVSLDESTSLGVFRNTYYDFPRESDYEGAKIPLKNARCETIREVARGFFETLCVQGSGTLSDGATVSFAKRDCACAAVCPRTEQRICFDVLDPGTFPHGRGASGKAITPLRTVAVDSDVIPLGTAIYIPEYDGLPRDPNGSSTHDGCFVAEDRGLRVKGKHVDVFTGAAEMTSLWNRLVPSNRGVRVMRANAHCLVSTELNPGR